VCINNAVIVGTAVVRPRLQTRAFSQSELKAWMAARPQHGNAVSPWFEVMERSGLVYRWWDAGERGRGSRSWCVLGQQFARAELLVVQCLRATLIGSLRGAASTASTSLKLQLKVRGVCRA
jgi:hypothetical protein